MAKAPGPEFTAVAAALGHPCSESPQSGGEGSSDCVKSWAGSVSLEHLQHLLALLLNCWRGVEWIVLCYVFIFTFGEDYKL